MYSIISNVLLLLWLLPPLSFVVCLYGEPCTNTNHCDIITEECKNGRCECTSYSSLVYFGIVPLCLRSGQGSARKCDRACDQTQFCNAQGLCECNEESKIMINGKCLSEMLQKHMDACYITDKAAYICSYLHYSQCINRHCTCFSDYFFNSTSKLCQPKRDYVSYYNLSSYKVWPGEYCLKTYDCANGLFCLANHTCSCPGGCSSMDKEPYCKCEPESVLPQFVVTSSWALSYSILIGLVSIFALVIVCSMLCATFKVGKRKPARSYVEQGAVEDCEPPKTSAISPRHVAFENSKQSTAATSSVPSEVDSESTTNHSVDIHCSLKSLRIDTDSESTEGSQIDTPDLLRDLP